MEDRLVLDLKKDVAGSDDDGSLTLTHLADRLTSTNIWLEAAPQLQPHIQSTFVWPYSKDERKRFFHT